MQGKGQIYLEKRCFLLAVLLVIKSAGISHMG